MKLMVDFAETLGDLLNEYNMNAKQFTEAIGAQDSSVSLYLRAMSIPTLKWLIKIADFFNCSTDYLLGLDENKNSGTYRQCPPFNQQIEYIKQYYKCSNSYFYTNNDISKTRFYDWLKGERVPTVESIVKLSKHFNCSVDFLIGRNKA